MYPETLASYRWAWMRCGGRKLKKESVGYLRSPTARNSPNKSDIGPANVQNFLSAVASVTAQIFKPGCLRHLQNKNYGVDDSQERRILCELSDLCYTDDL